MVLQNEPSPPRTPVHRTVSATCGTAQPQTPPLNIPIVDGGDGGEPDAGTVGPSELNSRFSEAGEGQRSPHLVDWTLLSGNERSDDREETSDTLISTTVNNIVAEVCAPYANITCTGRSPWGPWGSSNQVVEPRHEDSVSGDSDMGTDVSYSSEVGGDKYVSIELSQGMSPPPGFHNPDIQESIKKTPGDQEKSVQAFDGNPSSVPVSTQVTPEKIFHDRSPEKHSRSREQRVIRASVMLSPGYLKAWRPEGNRSLKFKLSRALLSAVGDPT